MSIFYCLSKRKRWLLLLLVLLSLQSKAFTQDSSRITVQGNNIPIETALRQIEKQSGFSFVYGKPTLDDTERITVDISGKGFTAVMDALLGARGIVWSFRGGAVVLSRRGEDVKMVADTVPRITVTGTVVDGQGKPLAASTILVKGTMQGTSTDGEGRFSLGNVPANGVLIVSSIGYDNKQVKISGKSTISITLNEVVTELKNVEVVSTGYQDIPKERATGSFVQLDNKILNRSVSTNILDRLIGITSGLNYSPNPRFGQSTIEIRGISTINANVRPLIVVDGFPYDESIDYSNVVNNINPNDIESITVLKDAAAASIWGVRAGNGVIVITTKRGRYNQPIDVQFNSNVTIGDKPNLFYLSSISSRDEIELEKTLFNRGVYDGLLSNTITYPVVSEVVDILNKERAGDISAGEAERIINSLSTYDVRHDIKKYLLQNSIQQQYALNISGGAEKFNYYSSIGYDQNRMNSVNDLYKRFTFRFNNIYKLTKKLEVNSYINYSQSITKKAGINFQEFLPTVSHIAPYTRLADGSGLALMIPYKYSSDYIETAITNGLLDWSYKPLNELELNDNKTKIGDARLGAGIRYNIISGVSLEAKYQFQKSISNDGTLNGQDSYNTRDLINRYSYVSSNGSNIYPVPIGGIFTSAKTELEAWSFRGQINLQRSWGDHNLAAIAGVENREVSGNYIRHREYGYNKEFSTISTVDYVTNFTIKPIGANRIPYVNDINSTLNRYVSYFGNAAYTFMNRYTFSSSARVDGSNFFGVKANQRIVPLWSVGVLWNISNENFSRLSHFPYLKIRATYGYNGNTNNSASAYTTMSYRSPSLSSNRLVSGQILSPPNMELRWEKVKMLNVGLDIESRNGRVSGSIEYYTKNGVDLIGPISVDATTGIDSYVGNRASIRVKGVDAVINTKNLTGLFKWNTNILFSYNRDKVTKYEQSATSGLNYIQGVVPVGAPLYSLYSYKWGGLDPSTGDPRIYIADTVSSYTNLADASLDDIKFHGSLTPTFFGAFRNTIEFKRLSLSVNITYKFGHYFRRTSVSYQNLLNGTEFGGHMDYLYRWKKPGDEVATFIPSLPTSPNSSRDLAYSLSEVLVTSASHIRLQDVRLSYNLNKSDRKAKPFRNFEVYLYMNNLGILWRANTQKIDPDYGDLTIPPSKSMALGLNVML